MPSVAAYGQLLRDSGLSAHLGDNPKGNVFVCSVGPVPLTTVPRQTEQRQPPHADSAPGLP